MGYQRLAGFRVPYHGLRKSRKGRKFSREQTQVVCKDKDIYQGVEYLDLINHGAVEMRT